MTFFEALVTAMTDGALAIALAGLMLRGSWRRSVTFAAYLAACLLGSVSTILWPTTFWTRPWWFARQVTYAGLKVAIAAELCAAVFAAFPGAGRAARGTLLGLLLMTFVSLTVLPGGGDQASLELFLPRLASGTLWLFVGVGAIAAWYMVPLHPLHRAILCGFVAFGVPFVAGLDVLAIADQSLVNRINAVSGPAYLATVCYWGHAAWTAAAPVDAPVLLARLAPWGATR